jgi:hypothetical protein
MGLCIVIDNQEANWEVIRTEQYGTTIKIKNGSIWNVQEYTDPKTGKRKLQIFREGANFNALQITRPAQAEGAAYGNAAENEDQKLRIFYSKWQGLQSPHRAPASFAVLDLRSGAGFAQQVLCICLPQKIETAQNRSISFNIINFERIPLNQSLINESLIQKPKAIPHMARTIWPLLAYDRMYQKGYVALAT